MFNFKFTITDKKTFFVTFPDIINKFMSWNSLSHKIVGSNDMTFLVVGLFYFD